MHKGWECKIVQYYPLCIEWNVWGSVSQCFPFPGIHELLLKI